MNERAANSDPGPEWVLLVCSNCDGCHSHVHPEYVGIGDPCVACGAGRLVLLSYLQRRARIYEASRKDGAE